MELLDGHGDDASHGEVVSSVHSVAIAAVENIDHIEEMTEEIILDIENEVLEKVRND